MDTKDAALMSLNAGAKVIGKSTAIFVITMQLSRKNMVNGLGGIFIKDASNTAVTNPLYKMGEGLAKKSLNILLQNQILERK